MAHSKKNTEQLTEPIALSQDSRDAQDAAKDLDGKKIAGKEVHHRKRRCNMTRKTEGWMDGWMDGGMAIPCLEEIWK